MRTTIQQRRKVVSKQHSTLKPGCFNCPAPCGVGQSQRTRPRQQEQQLLQTSEVSESACQQRAAESGLTMQWVQTKNEGLEILRSQGWTKGNGEELGAREARRNFSSALLTPPYLKSLPRCLIPDRVPTNLVTDARDELPHRHAVPLERVLRSCAGLTRHTEPAQEVPDILWQTRIEMSAFCLSISMV